MALDAFSGLLSGGGSMLADVAGLGVSLIISNEPAISCEAGGQLEKKVGNILTDNSWDNIFVSKPVDENDGTLVVQWGLAQVLQRCGWCSCLSCYYFILSCANQNTLPQSKKPSLITSLTSRRPVKANFVERLASHN